MKTKTEKQILIGDILDKYNLTVDLVHNKSMTERIYKAMEKYASLKVAEVKEEKLTYEQIKDWAKLKDGKKSGFKEEEWGFLKGAIWGAIAYRDGLIHKYFKENE